MRSRRTGYSPGHSREDTDATYPRFGTARYVGRNTGGLGDTSFVIEDLLSFKSKDENYWKEVEKTKKLNIEQAMTKHQIIKDNFFGKFGETLKEKDLQNVLDHLFTEYKRTMKTQEIENFFYGIEEEE